MIIIIIVIKALFGGDYVSCTFPLDSICIHVLCAYCSLSPCNFADQCKLDESLRKKKEAF